MRIGMSHNLTRTDIVQGEWTTTGMSSARPCLLYKCVDFW